jgi:nondiscriminating glutamyl-tRNA synthetase
MRTLRTAPAPKVQRALDDNRVGERGHMTGTGPRLRMAPAPSGFLHLGNIRTFLFDYLYAGSKAGALVLRIEDTDASRSTEEAESYIADSLHWLGIDWTEGPDVGGPFSPYRQSEREESHRKAAYDLLGRNAAYECFCTSEELEAERRDQQSRGQAPRYSGRCYRLSDAEKDAFRGKGRIPSIRFHLPAGQEIAWDDMVYGHVSFQADDLGDFIILRANGAPIYNLANVVDDHAMGISVVLRSQSHLSNTPRQMVLYEALGWEIPNFAHVPDVNDLQGRKMGKRYGAKGVPEYRAEGYLPEAIVNYIALLGWSPPTPDEFHLLSDLEQLFSFDRVQRSNAAFDPERLEWFNSQYIRRLTAETIAQRAIPFLRAAAVPIQGSDSALPQLIRIMPLVQERVRTLAEIPEMVRFFYESPRLNADSFASSATTSESLATALTTTADDLSVVERWTPETVLSQAKSTAQRIGWKHGDLLRAVRTAITGRSVSPPLTESMEILGRADSIRRLRSAAQILAPTRT